MTCHGSKSTTSDLLATTDSFVLLFKQRLDFIWLLATQSSCNGDANMYNCETGSCEEWSVSSALMSLLQWQ